MTPQPDRPESGPRRQAYEKPRLHVIDLKTDEVLATICKTDGTSDPLNPAACSSPTTCELAGS